MITTIVTKPRRKGYSIKYRCILTGADITRILFLHTEADAWETVRRHIPPQRRNFFRIIETRLATPAEIAEHKARIAAL